MTRYISADNYARIYCMDMAIDADARLTIETLLDRAAGPIDAARLSVGASSCTVSTSVSHTLELVNAIFAAVIWNCPCAPAMPEEAKDRQLNWAQSIVDAIGSGELEVCEGETGVNFPAVALPQIGWNDAIAAEIYHNYLTRTG